MAYNVRLAPRVIKYLKKLKDKPLKQKFLDVIYNQIAIDPYAGEAKTGDLSGIRTIGFTHTKTQYRVTFIIDTNAIILILLVGSHENYCEVLKRMV